MTNGSKNSTNLHVEFVVFSKDEVAASKGCNEGDERMFSPSQFTEQHGHDLEDGGQKGEVPSMLVCSLQNNLEFLL